MPNPQILIKALLCDGNGNVKCQMSIGDKNEEVKMTFSSNVRSFITIDRCDAMVVGLLMFAIRHGMDIESELPISETLYYKLTHHFVPGICTDKVYRPRIVARVVPDVDGRREIVATGISCGVDSLYSIMEHTDGVSDGFRLNHLVFLDAGAHHFGTKERERQLYEGRRKNAIDFCRFINLPLIEITTNLPEVLGKYSDYSHIEHHTFMMLSCVLVIQRGISRYYYSGGYPYSMFSCKLPKDMVLGCAHYDLLTLWAASNGSMEFLSTGGSLSRFEKVQALKGYEPAEKFLNVCVATVRNCGKCFKCKRTLLEIDAAGSIDKYDAVFDIDEYKATRRHRIKEGYRGVVKGDDLLSELTPFFRRELSASSRMKQRVRVLLGKIVLLFR